MTFMANAKRQPGGKSPVRHDNKPSSPPASGLKTAWKPGNALYPSPAVLVSCGRRGEKPNLLTVAWCGNVNSDPPMLSISVRPSRHSYSIIEETGEFVVNIPTGAIARAVDYCGVASGREIDKFAVAGLTPVPAAQVACPLVAECPINIECKVRHRLPLGTHVMYVAEVVAVAASRSLLDDEGRFRLDRVDLLFYAHGAYFTPGKKVGTFGWSVRKKTVPRRKKAKSRG